MDFLVKSTSSAHLGQFELNDYVNPSVTIRAWNEILQRIQGQAQDAEINYEFPGFAAGILTRAIRAGYGEDDVATLIEVLRGAQ